MPPLTSVQLKEQLATRPGQWYVVLDACDEPVVPPKVRELAAENVKTGSLYKGQSAESYWAIAPYLCELSPQTLDWIEETLGGKPWGIVIEADADFSAVHRHLRTLLSVRGPNGDLWYFRFYDPRVLSDFVKTSDVETAKQVFGPITEYYVSLKPGIWTPLTPTMPKR